MWTTDVTDGSVVYSYEANGWAQLKCEQVVHKVVLRPRRKHRLEIDKDLGASLADWFASWCARAFAAWQRGNS